MSISTLAAHPNDPGNHVKLREAPWVVCPLTIFLTNITGNHVKLRVAPCNTRRAPQAGRERHQIFSGRFLSVHPEIAVGAFSKVVVGNHVKLRVAPCNTRRVLTFFESHISILFGAADEVLVNPRTPNTMSSWFFFPLEYSELQSQSGSNFPSTKTRPNPGTLSTNETSSSVVLLYRWRPYRD